MATPSAATPLPPRQVWRILKIIEEDGLIARGSETGQFIREEIRRGVESLGILGEVRGKGCLVGVEFVQPGRKHETVPPGAPVRQESRAADSSMPVSFSAAILTGSPLLPR